MSTGQSETVASATFKLGTVWAAVGITSWSDVAAVLASMYTVMLIVDLLWKRFGRPYCERKGWIQRTLRTRRDDIK